MQRRDKSPQPMRHKVVRVVRTSSAKMLHSPRPPPENGSRPQFFFYNLKKNSNNLQLITLLMFLFFIICQLSFRSEFL
jgi:hypothetical protein